MEKIDSLLDPDYDEGSEDFMYCTPVADNEDDGYMTFIQYLSL